MNTDPMLLERILRNLISNAIKYTDVGSVHISARRGDEGLVLSVRDTGRGIPAQEHERIYEEFFQLDNPERDRTKGLGLGLAIVKRLAQLIDIKISMHSEPRQGTNFELLMPELEADSTVVQVDTGRSTPPTRLTGLRVLVVDDEKAVRAGMLSLLGAMGLKVELASSTAAAVAAARSNMPDIVLADLRLRGEDNGLLAIKSLRAFAPKLPALLISGDTAPDRLREAQEAGLQLLHKPVSGAALSDAIQQAISVQEAAIS